MVAKRRREIGVRIALGAGRADAIGLVWRRAVLLVTTGLIVGSAGAYGVGRLLASLAFGSSSGLPAILGACCILAMTSAVAAFVPAARAASVDPMQAFRSE
jgi:ABC-type antimicrobial peptide transport system permease subunit